ncbi:peptidase S41 family protein [Colletotrichum higginsianum]|nr:peptidase S41 family protein [Colletotrichum higginsianum]
MQFQSNLAYLKNPPAGYQQPAFDFMGALEELKHNVTAGAFKNQYDFEAMLQYLVYSVHDAHVNLYAGILSVFSYASPIPLVSASIDGKEAPKVYFADDIIGRRDNISNGVESSISAVSHINGEPVVEFLTRFAALQSVGMLEPHADWNELMDHPVQDVQRIFSIFSGSSTFYPGDILTFSFEDSSIPNWETNWLAIYNTAEYTGPLETSGDFYNFFVLGLLPDSYDEVPLPIVFRGPLGTENSPAAGDTPTGGGTTEEPGAWYNRSYGAFPQTPDIQQDNLDDESVLTGYFYEDISTGVLSIPHFNQYGLEMGTYGLALAQFIEGAKEKRASRIVIDLQKNFGGSTGIALLLFREFFPGIDPFAGSQRRSHELGNILGSAKTQYWQDVAAGTEEGLGLLADEWVIAARLNAETGRNFTSWEGEYEGPRRQNDDDFSLVATNFFAPQERYDLNNPQFHEATFDGWRLTRYLDDSGEQTRTMWKPDDVVILTDGTCSSACALFLELAKTQAGARTVVVGGAPKPGPMQAASGSRGARLYTGDTLDKDFSWISGRNESVRRLLPHDRNETGIFVDYAAFNLRDQLREDDTSTPLQFRYVPADCRLYFTVDNVYNMTALWHDVAHAAFENPSLCVEGSTGYGSRDGRANAPPESSAVPAPVPRPAVEFSVDYDPSTDNGLPAGIVTPRPSRHSAAKEAKPGLWRPCQFNGNTCAGTLVCQWVRYSCNAGGEWQEWTDLACVQRCQRLEGGDCVVDKSYDAKESAARASLVKKAIPTMVRGA